MIKQYPDDLVDISEIKPGTVLRDWFDEGVRVVVMRGQFSMNVYLGVPEDHPLAGHDYDSLPLDCHGGLTFASVGDGKYLPKGFYWYGYDYAHLNDYVWYSSGTPSFMENNHKWSLKEIVDDSWSPVYDFKKLMRLTERVRQKGGK